MDVKVNKIGSSGDSYQGIEIVIDNHASFSVYSNDYEPEHNNLGVNFEDCYDIPYLLEKAHQAGVKGEDLKITYHGEVEEY